MTGIPNLTFKIDRLAEALRNNWNTDNGACVATAYDVMVAVDRDIICEEHGSAWLGSNGLAIYFPEMVNLFSGDYNGTTIMFASDTRWDDFLLDFYSSMAGSWVATARDQSQGYNCISTDFLCGHIDLHDFCEKLIDNATGVIWVDFSYSGIESGSFDQPYNTVNEADTQLLEDIKKGVK
jgi:hypothetical protein